MTSWLFDFDQELTRSTCFWLTLAVGLFLVGIVLAQALLALGHHLWVTTGWLLGLVGLAFGTMLGDDVVTRANNGLLCGAAVATVTLALLLVRERRRWVGAILGRDDRTTPPAAGSRPPPPPSRPGSGSCRCCSSAPGRSSTPTTTSSSSWRATTSCSVEWLKIDNYGHFAPLTRLAYYAIQRTFGLDYTAVRARARGIGRHALPHPVLALPRAAGAPLRWSSGSPWSARPRSRCVRTMLWWGAAVHVLGAAAMMTLCVAAFVVWSRRDLERYRVVLRPRAGGRPPGPGAARCSPSATWC